MAKLGADRSKKRSPLLWGLLIVAISVIGLVLAVYYTGKGQKPGPISPDILSKIEQEKAKAQTEFAEFIETPAGKLWQRHPYWDPADCQKIADGQIYPGMSKEQAREAAGRIIGSRKKGENREEWEVEGKHQGKMTLTFDGNTLVSVDKKRGNF